MATTLRLSEELDARLQRRAERDGMSKQAVIARAIEAHLDQADRAELMQQAGDYVRSEYPDTLRRLGE